MHPIFVLLRKDFALLRRDRGRVVLTFLVPFAMIYIFGQVFGVNRSRDGNPLASELVGGWAMQFLLFAVAASATSLFEERDRGLFQRILSGPVRHSAILWSKFLYGVCLGTIQLVILFAAGRVLFGIQILPHLPLLALVCVSAATTCSAFGMLLASVARSSETAQGLSTLCILTMSALGGAWFPLRFMPGFMQHLSRVTLTYWSITGFRQVLSEHAPLGAMLTTVGILVGMSAILLSAAWWRFSRGRIF